MLHNITADITTKRKACYHQNRKIPILHHPPQLRRQRPRQLQRRQSHLRLQRHYRASRLEPLHLQVLKVGRMELEVRHHPPVHQELPQFQALQDLRLDRLELKVLQEQLGQLALPARPAQGQEVILALVEQPASQGSVQVERLAPILRMAVEAQGCCGCRRPWLQHLER